MVSKLIWQIDINYIASSHINDAVAAFYEKYKMKPTKVRFSVKDMSALLCNFPHTPLLTLEKGKEYSHFANTCCGPIELGLMEDANEVQVSHANNMNTSNYSFFIVENDTCDKEFEKHILDK